MRGPFLLVTALALSGCVKQSASYYISDRDHALTLRAEQQYLWQDTLRLTVTAARLPDCQRQIVLGDVALDDITVELYAAGENVFNLRAGEQTWQVETGGCTQVERPDAQELGRQIGSFVLDGEGKMVFEPAGADNAPVQQ